MGLGYVGWQETVVEASAASWGEGIKQAALAANVAAAPSPGPQSTRV